MPVTIDVFPTEKSVGTFFTYPARVISKEQSITKWQQLLQKSPLASYVANGMTLAQVAGQLSIDVAVGDVIINGFWVAIQGGSARLTGLPINTALIYIWLQLNKTSGLVSSASLSFNTSGTPPTDSALLGICATDNNGAASQVISASIQNSAPAPHLYTGTYTGDGTNDRTIFLGWAPRFVLVQRTTFTVNMFAGIVLSGLTAGTSATGARMDTGSVDPSTATIVSGSGRGVRPELSTLGFIVSNSQLNLNTSSYTYLAWP